MKKRVLALGMCLLVLLTVTGCTQNYIWQNNAFDNKVSTEKLKNEQVIAENEQYELKWVSTSCSVALVEKSTGLRWGTTPITDGEPLFDKFGMPIKKHAQVESAVVVEYLNPSTNLEETALSYTSAVSKGRVKTKQIDNGVKVEYYFDDVEIMIPIVYELRKDSVSVKVVTKEIQENDNKVTAISLTPFWCSAKNDSDNSYLVFPSGSGALINTNTLSQTGIKYSSQVYGKDPVMVENDLDATEKSIRVPMFGSKSQNTGTCAIIEESAESAVIETIVGSSAIKYSGIYAKFQIRGFCSNLASFMNGLEKKMNVYSKSMINTDLSVAFYPLKNNDANYYGMAKKYREYLNNKYSLNRIEEDVSINVTFVGGMMINKSFLGLPYRGILPVTTISEVKNILADISNKTHAHINARLIGFGSSGIDNADYVGDYKINSKLGTLKDLSTLSEFCRKNDIGLYYDFDIIKLKNNAAGYNKYFDVAYSALGKIADIYEYNIATRSKIDETKFNLLKRELLINSAEKLIKKTSKWNIDGFSFMDLSNTAYSDYSSDNTVAYYSKGQMEKDVSKILNMFSQKRNIATSDANVYAAVFSDIIYEAPICSSQEQIFAEDIPLYQLIFKGYKEMASENINLAANANVQLLKSIETGIGVSFNIIANYSNEMIDYRGYEFYGSKYSDIKEMILNLYNINKEYFKSVEGQEIINHNLLDNKLHETIFENGTKVYVNYTDKALISPLGEVAPNDYIWGGIS